MKQLQEQIADKDWKLYKYKQKLSELKEDIKDREN